MLNIFTIKELLNIVQNHKRYRDKILFNYLEATYSRK